MFHSHISLRLHLNVADRPWKDLTVFGWHFYPSYLSSIYPLLKILHRIWQGQQLWGVGCSSSFIDLELAQGPPDVSHIWFLNSNRKCWRRFKQRRQQSGISQTWMKYCFKVEGISIARNFYHFPNPVRIVFPTWNCDILLTGTDESWGGDGEIAPEEARSQRYTPRGGAWSS